MHPLNPLSGNAPYFSILLCLTPDDFTSQVESAVTQWVNGLLFIIVLGFSARNHDLLVFVHAG
jgi:hypothetical protein